jgi:uncharacterized protein YcfL
VKLSGVESMFKKSLILAVVATALAGCGSDDNNEIEGNSRGSVVINGSDFVAGGALTAMATDADGIRQDTLVYHHRS